MKKKGFTIIEILVVIMAIGVLMTGTIYLGANRIDILRYQSAKSLFVNEYERLQSNNNTTNYFEGKKFDYSTITILSGGSGLAYTYVTKDPIYIASGHIKVDENIKIRNMSFTGGIINKDGELIEAITKTPIDEASFIMKPYQIGCQLSGYEIDDKSLPIPMTGSIQFELFIENNSTSYCFEIRSDNCKIIQKEDKVCQNLEL